MAGKRDNYTRIECSISTTCSLKRYLTHLGINDLLSDDMLVRILCCLPLQSAVACKLVCKHWLSLISTPRFVSCFISKHHRHHQLQKYLILKAHGRYLFLTSQLPNSDISFSFLPAHSTAESSKVRILASSDDLFLCSLGEELDHNTTYFICNPFTKGCVELPPPPPSSAGHCFGFTCKPYYTVEGDRSECVTVNSSCRFRVVRLKLLNKMVTVLASAFEVDIFSSETWQWTTTMMHFPLKIQPISTTSLNGLMYWMCHFGEVVVYDPYNNKVCYVIYPPQDASPRAVFRFSISEGSLLAFQPFVRWSFKVWELEEWDQREWRLKSAVALKEYLVNSSEMLEWSGERPSRFVSLSAIAFHPNDKNVFFLWGRFAGIGTINLRTRVFKPRFVPKFSQLYSPARFRPDVQDSMLEQVVGSQMVVIKAPCWPTPISALFCQASAEPTD